MISLIGFDPLYVETQVLVRNRFIFLHWLLNMQQKQKWKIIVFFSLLNGIAHMMKTAVGLCRFSRSTNISISTQILGMIVYFNYSQV